MSNKSAKTEKTVVCKRSQATKVYKTIRRRKAPCRKDYIDAFVSKCDLTRRGAETYYYNLTSGPWSPKWKDKMVAKTAKTAEPVSSAAVIEDNNVLDNA
jgi:hypothetical protein